MTTTPHLISLPVGENGQRIFPIHCDWSKDTQYIIDFASQGPSNNIAVVQSVFINNEKGTADIAVDISGTASGYTVMAGQVGVFPIYANGLPKITLTAEHGSGQTTFAFANFSQPLFAYSAALIAQAVSDETLREAADVNPQNKHAAVTTYDPAVVKAIQDMQAATGLDFKYDGAGNALVSIATDKDAKGGILTDVGNAALSGGALKTAPQGLPTDADGNLKTTQQGNVSVTPATPGAFNDTRMSFDDKNRLECVVGEITLNGGDVTVQTQDKYDSNGSLISALYDDKGKATGISGAPLYVRLNETPDVNIANLPETQPVSGTVNVGNLPTQQHVVIDGNSTGVDLPVSVQNWPSLQTVQFSGTMPVQIENLVGIAGTPNVNISKMAANAGIWSVYLPHDNPIATNRFIGPVDISGVIIALGARDNSVGSNGWPRVIKMFCNNGPLCEIPLLDNMNGAIFNFGSSVHFQNNVTVGLYEGNTNNLTSLDSGCVVSVIAHI